MSDNYLKEIYLFDEIFNNLSEGISVLNIFENTVFVNIPFLKLTGFSFMEIIGEKKNILSFTKKKYPEKYKEIKKEIKKNNYWEGELWFENIEKHFFPIFCKFIYIDYLKENYIIEIFNDVTELNKHKEYFNYLKYYNEFLDLPNKIFLKEKIENKTYIGEKFSIILFTINNLKKINDTYGRKIGDIFLIKFSKRLKNLIKQLNISLFYLEGNQFIIILNKTKKDEILKILSEIDKKIIKEPIFIENFEINIEASFGCYIVNTKEDYYSIIHKLYIANEVSKNKNKKIVFYQEKFKDEIITKYKIEELIRKALKHNKFILFYQPRINIKNFKIESAEALIRMKTDDGKLISPGIFIPIAEESDLINKIGDWVSTQIIEDARYINMKSEESIKFSFNVSANQFLESDFTEKLKNVFKYSKDYNSKFEIEITEWALMKDIENSIEKMYELKETGFDLIIDDFGTGYSSLSYLKEFPVDFLKIDKAFTDGIPEDKKTVSIVKSIIFLAKQLGLKVTAEGVEHSEQYNWFKDNECDEIQGYYFSKPVNKDKLVKIIKIVNKPVQKTKYIKWEDSYKTGVAAFDAHHMIILNILNQIYEEIHDKKLKEKTDIINYLDMLKRYIKIHFKEEEKFLRKIDYKYISQHIKEHNIFKSKIKEIEKNFSLGKEKLDFEIFYTLKDYWKNHIQKNKNIFTKNF